jgi:peptidyl-prolyl cis-trans isomerase A (cyclophilin A)
MPTWFALFVPLSLALVACRSESSRERPAPGKAAIATPESANERAPEQYRARFQTTKGAFVVEVMRANAPFGADRFYNLVKVGFYDRARFFRVVPGFVVQWGLHAQGEPVMSRWRNAHIPDDPVVDSNQAGSLSFAMAGPGTRSTQVFVNYADNSKLDAMGFAPFGKIVEGMQVVTSLSAAHGQRPNQAQIQREGNVYLDREFPGLDEIEKATIVSP